MTKSVVCADISLEHKAQHSKQSISGLNHQKVGLIFNGGDPISSLDQRLSRQSRFQSALQKIYFGGLCEQAEANSQSLNS
jgi:hypothetical protein